MIKMSYKYLETNELQLRTIVSNLKRFLDVRLHWVYSLLFTILVMIGPI